MLVRAVRYTLSAARLATPLRMPWPTPCAGWDLRALLVHVGDSMDVLAAALSAGFVSACRHRTRGPPVAVRTRPRAAVAGPIPSQT